ncbi:sensor histidine kinase [Tenggerimyces flavus]|uniref:Sensor histidine kinase n=1 Tax=Tenggerimyces flavus TaxID=1708749 RepID=A0ABV7Y5B4_9ACTN|nr:sensor histidine kinase [Tenggerimyces flavus]MBM7790526.1 signal transduction histidine kinase [Tenggerimyces flavus]
MTTAREERSFIERSVPWWYVAFALTMAATAFALVASTDLPARTRLLGGGLIVLVVAAFLLVGRRVYVTYNLRTAFLYIGFFCLATLTMIGLAPAGYLMLFALFPQIWSMLPLRWAIGTSSALVLCMSGITIVKAGWTTDVILSAALTGVLVLGMGMLMGLWIHGIVVESERRKALIAELQETRTELADAHHREGVLAERERLAAEIHDTLTQGFLSILVHAQATDAVTKDEAVRERLSLIEQTARENLNEARSLVAALAPEDLRGRTLADALQRVADRSNAQVKIDGEPRTLPANAEVVLLRAAQEALTNVRKHADATNVEVTLGYDDDQTTLEIRDDGVGFDADSADGFGLRGMRSRVEQVSGTMTIETAPGNGTTIRLVVT